MKSTKKIQLLNNLRIEQSVLDKHEIKPELNIKFRSFYTAVSTCYKVQGHSLKRIMSWSIGWQLKKEQFNEYSFQ